MTETTAPVQKRQPSRATLRLVKTLHIFTVSIWLGAVVVAFALLASSLSDPERFVATTRWIPWIFSRILLPTALITILVGLYYGFLTNYGFIRNRWITVKWVLLLILIPCTATTIGSLATILVPFLESGTLPTLWGDATVPLILLAFQTIVLLIITILSVYKPALRKKTARN